MKSDSDDKKSSKKDNYHVIKKVISLFPDEEHLRRCMVNQGLKLDALNKTDH